MWGTRVAIGVTSGLLAVVFVVGVVWREARGLDAHRDMLGSMGWTHTASIDFCEANYASTSLLAEFQNTLSSLLIMAVSIWGHAALGGSFATLSFFWLFVTGAGSTVFHATLSREGQAADELGMMAAIVSMLQLQSGGDRRLYTLGGLAAVAAYFLSSNPALFQSMFVSCVALLIFRTVRESDVSPEAMHEMVRAAVVFSLGGALWLLEPMVCHWNLPIQLHSIWHLLSSLGCYFWLRYAKLRYGEPSGHILGGGI